MIYVEKFKMSIKDIDINNSIKNRAILEIFENIGAYHSDKVGYGANSIQHTGVSWVLLDWKMEVIKRPIYGDVLDVHTWGRGMYKVYTYRDYEIYDSQGNLCVKATSKWTLIDINKGKITRITDKIIKKYKPEEKNVFLEEKLDKITEPEEYTSSISYTVHRKDIDINGHMHNLYYLDLAYEALPKDVYNTRPFNNLRVTYKKEIKYGDTVICKYVKREDKNVIVIKNEENGMINSIIELY